MTSVRIKRKIGYLCKKLQLAQIEMEFIIDKARHLQENREKKISKSVRLFEKLQLSFMTVKKYCLRTRSFLFFRPEAVVGKIRHISKLMDLNKEQCHTILSRYPEWLSYSISLIERRLRFLLADAANRQEAHKRLNRHPQMLSCDTDTMLEQIRTLISFGFDDNESKIMIEHSVHTFSMSAQHNVGSTTHYLLHEVGFSFQSITSSPAILSISLFSRMVPVHEELLTLRIFDLQVSRSMFSSAKCSNEEFVFKKKWHFVRRNHRYRCFSRATAHRQSLSIKKIYK
jgi:hypothetical protein